MSVPTPAVNPVPVHRAPTHRAPTHRAAGSFLILAAAVLASCSSESNDGGGSNTGSTSSDGGATAGTSVAGATAAGGTTSGGTSPSGATSGGTDNAGGGHAGGAPSHPISSGCVLDEYEISGSVYYLDAIHGDDSNPGSETEPFQTMAHALSQLTGGDGLLLYGGNYGEVTWGRTGDQPWTQQPIPEVYTDWVTVKAVEGEKPVFERLELGTWNQAGTSVSLPFSELGNSDLRMRFDGITIEDGVSIQGSRHVELRNCTIRLTGDIQQERNSVAGVSISNGRHISLLNNEVTHTGVGVQAMTTDFVFRCNDVHETTHDGLSILGGENWLVEGNVFRELDDGVNDDVSWGNHVDGIHLYFVNGDDPKWARIARNFVFRGNLFYHIESMALMLGDSGLGRIEDFLWENNLFGPMSGRLFIQSSNLYGSCVIRHNTVLYAPNDSWTSVWGREFTQADGFALAERFYNLQIWGGTLEDNPHQANYEIYNNIFTSATPSYSEFGFVANNIYISGSEETLPNGERRVAELPYTEIPGNIQDFIDSGGVLGQLVSGSPAIDAGTTEGTHREPIQQDYAWNDRDETPDIGALEWRE